MHKNVCLFVCVAERKTQESCSVGGTTYNCAEQQTDVGKALMILFLHEYSQLVWYGSDGSYAYFTALKVVSCLVLLLACSLSFSFSLACL